MAGPAAPRRPGRTRRAERRRRARARRRRRRGAARLGPGAGGDAPRAPSPRPHGGHGRPSASSDLQAAIDDPGIRAIWSVRGGYGATRLVGRVDWSSMVADPRWFVGLSDVTALHHDLWRATGVVSCHGTNAGRLAAPRRAPGHRGPPAGAVGGGVDDGSVAAAGRRPAAPPRRRRHRRGAAARRQPRAAVRRHRNPEPAGHARCRAAARGRPRGAVPGRPDAHPAAVGGAAGRRRRGRPGRLPRRGPAAPTSPPTPSPRWSRSASATSGCRCWRACPSATTTGTWRSRTARPSSSTRTRPSWASCPADARRRATDGRDPRCVPPPVPLRCRKKGRDAAHVRACPDAPAVELPPVEVALGGPDPRRHLHRLVTRSGRPRAAPHGSGAFPTTVHVETGEPTHGHDASCRPDEGLRRQAATRPRPAGRGALEGGGARGDRSGRGRP